MQAPMAGGMPSGGARRETLGRRWSMARDVVTPATAALFATSTVTGIMLLLHWRGGLVHSAHEWLSVVFSAVAAWHLVKNWRAFSLYLKRNLPLVATVLTLVASLAFTAVTARGSGDSGPPPIKAVRLMTQARLADLAPVLKTAPDALRDSLRQRGYKVVSIGETLAAVAASSGAPAESLLFDLMAAR